MLATLHIKDLAIIEDLEVELGAGMNVFTGETGAGKSILVDGLNLLCGEKSDPELVRQGAEAASVEGTFTGFTGAAIVAELREEGIAFEGDELIVRRVVGVKGKSRAWINGSAATLPQLRRLAASLVFIHGQSDQQQLREAAAQLAILDAFGASSEAAAKVAEGYRVLRRLDKEVAGLAGRERERARRLDIGRHEVAEIDAARLGVSVPGGDLSPGGVPLSGGDEEVELHAERRLLGQALEVGAACAAVTSLLADDEGAAQSRMAQAVALMARVAGAAPWLSECRDGLAELQIRLGELTRDLERFATGLEADPARLERIEERLYTIERLKKKYGPTIAAVLAYRAEVAAELQVLERDAEDRARLEAQRDAEFAVFRAAAVALAGARRRSAEALRQQVERELSELAMHGSRFLAAVESEGCGTKAGDEDGGRRDLAGAEGISGIEWEGARVRYGANGLDRVTFQFSANPGEEPRPLAKVASGGELSRLQLALESVCHGVRQSGLRCLVFDEVDSGIGGAVAEIVGRKLRRLAERDQVLCVTHLPQVAAQGASHFRVSKELAGGRTVTRIELLEGEARIEELARMAGGLTVGDAARRHARDLLVAAQPARRPRRRQES